MYSLKTPHTANKKITIYDNISAITPQTPRPYSLSRCYSPCHPEIPKILVQRSKPNLHFSKLQDMFWQVHKKSNQSQTEKNKISKTKDNCYNFSHPQTIQPSCPLKTNLYDIISA